MKIGIDGLLLRQRNAGSLRYWELLLEALAQHATGHEIVLFAAPEVLPPSNSKFLCHPVEPLRFIPGALRQQLYNGWHASEAGKQQSRPPVTLDVLHSAVFAPPLRYPGRTVMTVFDLTFLLYPQTQKWTGRLWWRLLGPPGIRKANHLLTISESTRSELCRRFNLDPHKVTVAYPYRAAHLKPPSDHRTITARYGLPEKYILFVGTLERRKNIATLLRAFARARQNAGLEHCLALVGRPGWLYEDIQRTVQTLGIEAAVRFLGHVPDQDLPALYAGASLFAYLSIYEGFGLPVLEAMSCGAPVLTSNVSSLPEVAGQAGLLVNPEDEEQASQAIIRVLTDPLVQAEMSARGLEQARRFTRARFAAATLAAYEQAMSSPR